MNQGESEQDLAHVLALEAQRAELLDPPLVARLLLLLSLVRQALNQLKVTRLVAHGWVVVLVEVDLAQEEHVLAANKEDAALDVCKEAPCAGRVGFRVRVGVDALDSVLKNEVG